MTFSSANVWHLACHHIDKADYVLPQLSYSAADYIMGELSAHGSARSSQYPHPAFVFLDIPSSLQRTMSAQVAVDFSNTGDNIITVSYDSAEGNPQPPIVVRPNQIVRRNFIINFSYFLNFTCGRFGQSATFNFSNGRTIDVNKYFV